MAIHLLHSSATKTHFKKTTFFFLLFLLWVFFVVNGVVALYSAKLTHHYFIEHQLFLAIFFYSIPYLIILLLYFKFSNFVWLQKKTFYILLAVFLVVCYFFYPSSDDVNRYLWEGHISQKPHQINPYSVAPEKLSPQEVGFTPILYQGINNKDKSAIYGPLFMFIMQKITFVSHNYLPYKVITSLLFCLTMLITLSLLKSYHLPYKNLLFFLLNPLVCLYLVGAGHNDIFLIFFLSLTFFFYQKKKFFLTILFFLCAVQIKIILLLFFPFFLKKEFTQSLPLSKFSFMPQIWFPILLLGLSFLLYLPFLQPFSFGQIQNLFSSLFYFGNHMSYNAFVYFWLPNRFLHVFLFITIMSWIYFFTKNPFTLFTFVYLIFLCFAPTIHPWYLGILLWLNVFCQSRAIWLWSVCFVFTFIPLNVYYLTGEWQDIGSWRYLVHFPFLILLSWELLTARFRNTFSSLPALGGFAADTDNSKIPLPLSIVIPLANKDSEKKQFNRTLQMLKQLKTLSPKDEVIVVESSPQTSELQDYPLITSTSQLFQRSKRTNFFANRCPYFHYQSKIQGRGIQIDLGIEKSTNPIVCILHSDIMITDSTIAVIRKSFQDNKVAHLAFNNHYDSHKNEQQANNFLTKPQKNDLGILKMVSWFNQWRGKYLQIFFGDQVQCFRKDSLVSLGGYPRLYLMEDIELSLKYKTSFFKTIFIEKPLPISPLVSTRKWLAKARAKKTKQHAWQIIFLCFAYLCQRFFMINLPTSFTGKSFMKKYYQHKEIK